MSKTTKQLELKRQELQDTRESIAKKWQARIEAAEASLLAVRVAMQKDVFEAIKSVQAEINALEAQDAKELAEAGAKQHGRYVGKIVTWKQGQGWKKVIGRGVLVVYSPEMKGKLLIPRWSKPYFGQLIIVKLKSSGEMGRQWFYPHRTFSLDDLAFEDPSLKGVKISEL
jgi:hypothetical protein